MENTTLDLIHQHASVRHYTDEAISAQTIETILAAGQRASTSSNLQLYSVIVVTATGMKEQLAQLADNQDFIRQAPVFLTWCADLARMERVCQLQNIQQVSNLVDNFLTAVVDASLAAQNAALAAESLGLGICYVGALRSNTRAVIDLLHLPRLVLPLFGMTVGKPARQVRRKTRLPLEAIVHWEAYRSDQDALLHDYDRVMAESGIYNGRQTSFPGRSESMEPYGWLEHSARRTGKASRQELRQILVEQGFLLE
jgi:FMN reductase (NADPH)